VPLTATIRLSALNLVIIDSKKQNPKTYEDLFEDLARLGRSVAVRGEQYLELDSNLRTASGMIHGTLHRFTAVEAMNWFNTEKHRRASEADIRAIRIPANIAANYREIPFMFHLGSHTMIFLTKSTRALVSATQVQVFMSRSVSQGEIAQKYGDIAVTIEQDEQELDRILQSSNIKMLKVTVNRPNESFRRFDKQIYDRLAKMGAKSASEEYHADEEMSLKPDDDVRNKARAAVSNGRVDAKIVTDGRVEDVSTMDKPRQERVTYNTKKETLNQAFSRGARAILEAIIGPIDE